MQHSVLVVDDDGKDALDKLRGHAPRPCLIVLDLMMPVMDGREFREQQLRTPELADIPVVVVSAVRNIAESAREMKVQAHLCKPLDGDELIAAARRYCQHEAA